jgi:hypothetical protein
MDERREKHCAMDQMKKCNPNTLVKINAVEKCGAVLQYTAVGDR